MYGPQQEQQPSPPLPQPQRDPVPLPQQQNTSSKITISQMQEQLLLSKHIRFTSLVSCMGYSMPEMAPAYLVRESPGGKNTERNRLYVRLSELRYGQVGCPGGP